MPEKQLYYLTGAMDGYPFECSYGFLIMMDALCPTRGLVCTLSPDADMGGHRKSITQLANLAETSEGLSVVVKTEKDVREMEHLAPYTRDYLVPETGELSYLCVGHERMQSVSQLEQLIQKLREEM